MTNLNEAQQKAVYFERGPLLVIAGAGTGKTRIITDRIKHLIQTKSINPTNVLALTFTDKAAQEMVNRLDEVMPLGYEEPWVCTFHAFAERVLKRHGYEIGLNTKFRILTKPYEWLLFRKHLFKFDLAYFRPLGNPTKFITDILEFISRLQDETISVTDLESYAQQFSFDIDEVTNMERIKWNELAHIYKTFQQIKADEAALSFGDLVAYTYELFTKRPNVLKLYKDMFSHILVDEFQDTNFGQYQLIKLLYPASETSKRSLLVVGDDSQSIYKFRGAAVANILGFMTDYKDAGMVTLTLNYRSTQAILDSSYKVIQNNNPETLESRLNISKKLTSNSDIKLIKPRIVSLETQFDEVEFVMQEILQLLASPEGFTYKDIAIIARSNASLDAFVLGLRKHGLPYQLVGNRGLYDKPEIKSVIDLLYFITNPFSDDHIVRVLSIDAFAFTPDVIAGFLAIARKKRESVWDVLQAINSPQASSFCDRIRKYQTWILKLTPATFVYEVLTDLNYITAFLKEESIETQLAIKNLDMFLGTVKRFEAQFTADKKEIPTIIDYIDELEYLLEAGDNPGQAEIEDIDTISLLTVHASKGLEFACVFMVNLIASRFPSSNRRPAIAIPDALLKEEVPEGDTHIAEERRLFYVGMTRAKKRLYMTFAKDYGGKKKTVPSGFLLETGYAIEDIATSTLSDASQLGLFGVESGYKRPSLHNLPTLAVPDVLSFSQIDTYTNCGLQYKFRYVLNIPSPPSHVLSFGQSMHETLKEYHTKRLLGQTPDLAMLFEYYKEAWVPAGYLDKDHEKLRFDQGKTLLENYYKENSSKSVKHIAIEKSFKLYLEGTKFIGKIDRIDEVEGGVEILDYKTGSSKNKGGDTDDQLNIYAYGVINAMRLTPVKLTYYFLESGEKMSFTANPALIEASKKRILDTAQEINAGNFKPNPGMICKWCDYRNICPYAAYR